MAASDCSNRDVYGIWNSAGNKGTAVLPLCECLRLYTEASGFNLLRLAQN